jgi:serralysin
MTTLDSKSIMLYPIKKSWTLDGFSSGLNTTLSPIDIAFIRMMYPAM